MIAIVECYFRHKHNLTEGRAAGVKNCYINPCQYYIIHTFHCKWARLIHLYRKIHIMIEKADLESVLKSTLSLSGCNIKVKVSKSTVTLTGRVQSAEQKGEAEQIAWKVIGVWTVGNELVIDHA